ncbi:MAG: IPT/TIG domain-containing protein [Planctomycetota bacterium]
MSRSAVFRCAPHAAWTAPLALALAACSGGGGGGDDPPQNLPPTMQLPPGLAGIAPRVTATLPIAGTQTYTLTASDPDGEELRWEIAVPAAAALAAGLAYQTPVTGPTVSLSVAPVAAPVAVPVSIVVEDARGATAAIEILLVRSGLPRVDSVSPTTAFLGRPQRVSVRGAAFSLGGTQTPGVFFGTANAGNIAVVGDGEVQCDTPTFGALAGRGDVAVANSFGTDVLPDAFTMFSYPPRLAANDTRLDAGGPVQGLHVELDGDRAHAVHSALGVLQYRRSTDGGATWLPSAPLSGVEPPSEPRVWAAGDEVMVAWIGDGNSVRFRRSVDGGANFEPEQRLDALSVGARAGVRLTGDGLRRNAIWIEGEPLVGQARAYAAASDDGGATWSAAAPVVDPLVALANQSAAEITAIGDLVLAIYLDDRAGAAARGLFGARSLDGGVTWQPDVRMSAATGQAAQPRLRRTGDIARACWVFRDSIYVNDTSVVGIWRQPEVLVRRDTDFGGALSSPDLGADGDRVWVTYLSFDGQIWVARSTDGGGEFGDHRRLDADADPAAQLGMTAAGNYLTVAWLEQDGTSGLFRATYAMSTDRGLNWDVPREFGDADGPQESLQVCTRGAGLLFGWLEHRSGLAASPAAFVNASTPQ